MSKPTVEDAAKLKRFRRFLKGHLRTTHVFPFQRYTNELTVHTDANWAGDKRTRKSTSGGSIRIGQHLIKTWSKTQSLIALSSAESELYGVVKAASEALGIMSVTQDFGRPLKAKVFADASAALGIIVRRGLGKVRHIDTNFLWVQEISARREIDFNKIPGGANEADMMTKGVTREIMERHVKELGLNKNQPRPQSES